MATNDNTEAAPFEESDLISLGEKLAALDLSTPERAALAALISDDDVGGFGRYGGRFDIIGGLRKGMGFREQQPFGLRAGLRDNTAPAPFADGKVPKPGRI